ncbi:MAG: nuclear transport factor 2 family protein [Candidatus Tumulicola sp.]
MNKIAPLLLVLTFVLGAPLVLMPLGVAASSPSASDELIRLEARWITAILDGDRSTVGSILSQHFKHVTNEGTVIDRAQELANIKKEPFKIALSEQTVDFNPSGDAAVLHGLDTITQPGKPTKRQRFTDVFFKVNGTWLAISAQENVIAP